VAALERETGTQLLERGSRGVRATEAGRVLIEQADAILARIECAEEELAALAGLRGGRLRLISFRAATPCSPGPAWPSRRMRRLRPRLSSLRASA
jgi:DNA-binding transcriptional LysR family regulator